jgi:hypothetical protein
VQEVGGVVPDEHDPAADAEGIGRALRPPDGAFGPPQQPQQCAIVKGGTAVAITAGKRCMLQSPSSTAFAATTRRPSLRRLVPLTMEKLVVSVRAGLDLHAPPIGETASA